MQPSAVAKVKGTIAAVMATLIIWKPTIVVMFPGFIYTSDLSTVLLTDQCVAASSGTVFVFCMVEILAAAALLKSYVGPMIFSGVS